MVCELKRYVMWTPKAEKGTYAFEYSKIESEAEYQNIATQKSYEFDLPKRLKRWAK